MVSRAVAWLNGHLVDAEAPQIMLRDHGFTVGDGVFESVSLGPAGPFALTRHLRRLGHSALGLGLAEPDEALVRDAVSQVVRAWREQAGDDAAAIRITWTPGPGGAGSARPSPDVPGTLAVLATASRAHPPARLWRSPWPRNERGALAGLKTLSYAENAAALAHARRMGATESVFGNTRGELCDGATSTIFLEDDDGLVTPPLSAGVLAGVTRELVLEWGVSEGLPVREQTLPLEALVTAPHVALTASSRGIAPVVAVEGREVPPGPVTLAMAETFARRRAADPDP